MPSSSKNSTVKRILREIEALGSLPINSKKRSAAISRLDREIKSLEKSTDKEIRANLAQINRDMASLNHMAEQMDEALSSFIESSSPVSDEDFHKVIKEVTGDIHPKKRQPQRSPSAPLIRQLEALEVASHELGNAPKAPKRRQQPPPQKQEAPNDELSDFEDELASDPEFDSIPTFDLVSPIQNALESAEEVLDSLESFAEETEEEMLETIHRIKAYAPKEEVKAPIKEMISIMSKGADNPNDSIDIDKKYGELEKLRASTENLKQAVSSPHPSHPAQAKPRPSVHPSSTVLMMKKTEIGIFSRLSNIVTKWFNSFFTGIKNDRKNIATQKAALRSTSPSPTLKSTKGIGSVLNKILSCTRKGSEGTRSRAESYKQKAVQSAKKGRPKLAKQQMRMALALKKGQRNLARVERQARWKKNKLLTAYKRIKNRTSQRESAPSRPKFR